MLDDRIQRTKITADEWRLGGIDAPVTLLEYGDFECPHCGAARPVLERLVRDDPRAFQLIYRHFPVTTVHPHAMAAAEAAEAAGAQGKFWEMHDLIFTYQDRLEPVDLRRYAGAIGLDPARFDLEMASHAHQATVREDVRRGIQDGVNGTPTIFIHRVRYDGPRERESILAAVAALEAGIE